MSLRVSTGMLAALVLCLPPAAQGFSLTTYRRGPVPLPANYVPAVALDGEQKVWIGTGGGGLITLSAKGEWKPVTAEEGFSGQNVSSIVIDGDTVYVGTQKGLFTRRGETWDLLTQAGGGKFDYTTAVALQGKELWVGATTSAGGLFRRKADGSWERLKGPGDKAMNDVVALLPVGDVLWIGTMNNGLFRYEKGAWTQYDTPQGLPHFYVSDVAWDGRGLWVAMLQGGIAYLRDGKITPYTDKDGLPSMSCRKLLWDRDTDTLWIGTVREGVIRYDGSRWIVYAEADGLPSNNTYALAKGAGKGIWVGTDGGLVYLEP